MGHIQLNASQNYVRNTLDISYMAEVDLVEY